MITHIEKAAETEHDHAHEKTAEAEHDHGHENTAEADHEGHDHGAFDAHVWLDPVNAKAMVHEIEEALAEADPANAARYEANAEAVTAMLDTLIAEVSAELEPVKGKGFIVFPRWLPVFRKAASVSPPRARSRCLRKSCPAPNGSPKSVRGFQELGAACVFAEPQFEPKLVSTVIEGTDAKAGTLDPLGAELEGGPELYFQLIRNMSTSIKTCLTEAS